MKKFAAIFMALTMVLTLFAGCTTADNGETTESTDAVGETGDTTTESSSETVTGDTTGADMSLEEIINEIYTQNPVEFMTINMPIDVTDTSEDGLLNLKYFTGLDNADMITEAVVSEAGVGSIPFSMVLVRVKEGQATAVADAMRDGIDQRKWLCVEADDLMVVTKGDIVMLVMIGSEQGNADSFVTAFTSVVGEPEYVIG